MQLITLKISTWIQVSGRHDGTTKATGTMAVSPIAQAVFMAIIVFEEWVVVVTSQLRSHAEEPHVT
jgi:hypothetical protein